MTYPPLCDRLVFAGRTNFDLCELRIRGVRGAAGGVGDAASEADATACFNDCMSRVLAYDITTVPWGQFYNFDYGFHIPLCSHTEYFGTLADFGVAWNTLWGYQIFGANGTIGNPGTTWGWGIQRFQIILPPPWSIFFGPESGDTVTCLANNSLTSPAVDSARGVTFCPVAGRLIDLPVPSERGSYAIVPCQNCTP